MEIVSANPRTLFKPENIQTESLTPSEVAIVQASISGPNNPRIREHDDLLTLATKISNTVQIRMGLRPKMGPELEVVLQALEADLMKFPNMTEAEILKALNMGIDGEFNPDGDIFFSSSQFVQWIRAYIDKTKKPVIAKHAQLLHQVKEPKKVLTHEEQVKSAADCANMYAAARRENPEHRAVSAGPLYENIERLGIYKISSTEKWEIVKEIAQYNPGADDDALRDMARSASYNRFIRDLVDFGQMVSDDGRIVDLQ